MCAFIFTVLPSISHRTAPLPPPSKCLLYLPPPPPPSSQANRLLTGGTDVATATAAEGGEEGENGAAVGDSSSWSVLGQVRPQGGERRGEAGGGEESAGL